MEAGDNTDGVPQKVMERLHEGIIKDRFAHSASLLELHGQSLISHPGQAVLNWNKR
jgi:hypothetical protein